MGKGSSGEMVVQVRQDIERIRVDLLMAIADGYVAWKNPADAVRFLEEAHSWRPDLDPIARRFAEVLRAAGQPSGAKPIEASIGSRRKSSVLGACTRTESGTRSLLGLSPMPAPQAQ